MRSSYGRIESLKTNIPIWFGLADIGTRRDRRESFLAMDAYFDAGGRQFDTAHCYAAWLENGEGVSERLFGEWIAERDVRKEIIIATKGGHVGFGHYPRPERYLDPALVRRDFEQSLERMRVDRVEVYFYHRDHRGESIENLAGFMSSLLAERLIDHAGISNWTAPRAKAMAKALPKVKYWQNQWSLGRPTWEPTEHEGTTRYHLPEDLVVAEECGYVLMPYSSTANGFYGSNGASGPRFDSPENRMRLERVNLVSEKTGFTRNQVALMFMLSQPIPPVEPIIGTLDPERIVELLSVSFQRLSQETLDYLDLKTDIWLS